MSNASGSLATFASRTTRPDGRSALCDLPQQTESVVTVLNEEHADRHAVQQDQQHFRNELSHRRDKVAANAACKFHT
jgi:hypothetical protein